MSDAPGPERRESLDASPEVDNELAFHLEMRARELVDRGLAEEEARRAAARRFGNYDASRRECVEIDERKKDRMKRTQFWSELRQDLAYAFRMYRRSPGFTAVALITLALGIGANSAIFSVVHGVLLQALPWTEATRTYRIRTLYPDGTPYSLSAPDFASLRQDTRAFERIEAYATVSYTMLGQGEPRDVLGYGVSDGLFEMLGLAPRVGRTFRREEHDPGRGDVAVLDHGFWVRHFGGDPSAVGRTVSLAGRPFTVVGVLAPEARLPVAADLYTPIVYDETFKPTDQPARRGEFLAVLGRARPGVDAAAVNSDLGRVGSSLQQQFPTTNTALTFDAASLRQTIVGDVETPLLMLLGAVGFVLLVACANVASLLLARASARQQEIAVRAALGASRRRLMRQLITESVVLALSGAIAGLAVAYAGTRALIAARPADIPRLERIGVDSTVVLVTLGVAVLTGLLFGLFPAFQATAQALTQTIREGGRGVGAGRAGHRVRAGLVVAEMALAVVLLMGAGLLIRSFVELTRVPTGFDVERGMTFNLSLQGPAYRDAAQVRARVAQFEARLKALPGVTAAGASTVVPLTGRGSMVDFSVVGAPPPPANVNAEIAMVSVTPDYFRAIGTPLLRGRNLSDGDIAGAPLVVLINEAGVKRWFEGQDPIGKFVTAAGQPREIVGVVKDIKQRDLSRPSLPSVYVPYAQRASRAPRFVVRSTLDLATQGPAIRNAFREIDPNLALSPLVPFTQLVDDSVARPRFYTSLLSLFAAAALTLAATGIFGVMSYAVAQRSREISIRMALGARAGAVLVMIVGRALALAVLGVALGIAATFGLGRVIQSQLFGVAVMDPTTLAGVAAVLITSAALASFLPARRAAGIDPANALRQG
ncbi:MAG TPA: ABC transporter permease [Vicinamibacterales bacterium]|nr:ABC transporter permease [Vicinamibacterales bacterium]